MQEPRRIEQKWGFGMAPVKPAVQQQRIEAARTVLATLAQGRHAALGRLDDLSTVKGLFTRSYKKDQWDWFTVWGQLGFPSHTVARQASGALLHLFRCIRDVDAVGTAQASDALRKCDVPATLERYVTGTPYRPADHGFVYVLSTREAPTLLKIGYTDRDIATRAREINASTGVVVPYGARGAWLVPHARHAKAELHARLAEFRVRKDREFFLMEYREAAEIIDTYVGSLRATTACDA
ncbi:GIY-YIG nuclease family protein [Streptomyces sp. NPDC050803]|uniref:GIY-YIG nuclease family protein n=1 Tax=unclassified Streptomyces TaxID=2593676 RepID=UPI0034194C08